MGQFSEVWKGEWRGEVVIINIITPDAESSFDLLDKCAFLKSMEHENHIRLLGVYMTMNCFWL